MTTWDWGSIYKEIGAKPVINAIGSVTLLGGSIPTPEVRAAMDRANEAYIPLSELQQKAGDYIAKMIGVPAAYVTSGAGSALSLAAAAAMAGDDDQKIQQLPDTTGMKNEILIQKRQRYWYDRCLETAGAKLVEFGTAEGATKDDLEKAIGPRTAAVHFFAQEQNPDPKLLPLKDLVEVASAHGLPVLVDAAGQVYPLENLPKYVKQGAAFSCVALKYMGAPHSVGLALGTKEFIGKLALQSFVSYETRRIRGIGRPQKVDRQEIIGAVAAVKQWLTMDHEKRLADAERKTKTILGYLQGIKGVKVQMINNIIGPHAFGLRMEVDPTLTGLTVWDVVDKLKSGDPPIWTRVRSGEHWINIHVFGLRDGEDQIVGQRIAALFKR